MCTQVSVSDLSDGSVAKMIGLFSEGSDPTSGRKEGDKNNPSSFTDDFNSMC